MRKYYADSYTTQFETQIAERLTLADSRRAVVLNESYFYPTSGGQPHDTGTLNGVRLVDVQVREQDGAVLHVLESEVEGDAVSAQIDWPRRFDLMQQHTGQHILSAALFEVAEALTVGFHLGAESSTIDLATDSLSADEIARAERLANEIVWENRPITAQFIPKADIPNYPLRKIPDVPGDALRLVIIPNFDYNACGGTHVRGTAEVGMVKVNRVERVRGQVRVEFRCGARALADYDRKERLISQLANDLTCAMEDLPHNVANMQRDIKQANKRLKKQGSQLLQMEAQQLAVPNGTTIHVFKQRDANELRQLANGVVRAGNGVALLAAAGSPATLAFARAKSADGDMNALLQAVLAQTDGTGGGSATFAAGGGFKATVAELEGMLRGL